MRPTCSATGRIWWLPAIYAVSAAPAPIFQGLEDVHVVQMVDGMRLPDFYNGGPTNFTLSGR